ncbi:MAG: hypothetical protein AAB909_00275, partial [Patescibacteria group bacterium]
FAKETPEVSGDYPDPANPMLRVRVFVHEPRRPVLSENLLCTDPDSQNVVDTTGWHLSSSISYRLNLNNAPTDLVTIAELAFGTWQTAANDKVIFQRGADTSVSKSKLDYQNVVAWNRTSGNALATTYTRYYPSTGLVADVDTIFNRRFPWGWSTVSCNPNYYDSLNVLTHEVGHWMGLDDEYTAGYLNNTMYGYADPGEIKKDTLTTGDSVNLPTIYP